MSLDAWRSAIETRLRMVETAASRSRWTLAAASVVSIAVALIMFDYMLSWNKDFALSPRPGLDAVHQEIEGEIVKEWLSTQTFEVPLLGIKVMASDLPLIASPALAVFSMWLFFSFRREHYTVGRLLGDVYRALDPRIDRDPEALLVAQLVYHGVVSQMVFNVVGLRARFVTLDTPVQPPVADLPIFDPVRLNRAIVRWLVWLPTIAIAFITLMRALTFAIIASPVTGTAHSLWDLSSRRVVLVIATILSVLVSLAVTIFNARQVLSYEKETRKVLNEYQRWAFDRP